MVAQASWLLENTGPLTLMGLVLMCSTLPGLLLEPFGEAFADRHPRKRSSWRRTWGAASSCSPWR